MAEDRIKLIEKLRSLPAELVTVVSDLSSTTLTTAYIDGEWTVAQNVHHLTDAQMNLFIRFKNMVLSEEPPTLMPFEQDDWAESTDSTHPDLSGALAILVHLQHRWQRLALSLTEEQWNRTGNHPEQGVLVASDVFVYGVNHVQMHIDQIKQVLAAKDA